MVQGKIEGTNKSKSGKTLGVLIGGTWYTTKAWELENMKGQEIAFEPSTEEFPQGSGKYMHWLNDYTEAGGGHAPNPQGNYAQPSPPVEAYVQPPPAPMTQAQVMAGAVSPPNKDSVIGAMGLCKCCVDSDPETVFANFVFLYHKLEGWDHTTPF